MKAPGNTNRMLYGLLGISVILIGFGVFRSLENAGKPQAAAQATGQPPVAQSAALVALKQSADLGSVSMAAGNVSYRYMIKNAGMGPLTVKRISTSCMCTNATLVTASGRKGPFGMPGHGPNTTNAVLRGGEVANVEVVFDPAAHGPSGLGPVDRTVTIESVEAAPLELRFVAMVKP